MREVYWVSLLMPIMFGLPSNENNIELYNICLVPPQDELVLIEENLSVDSMTNNCNVSSDFQPGTCKLIVYVMALRFI